MSDHAAVQGVPTMMGVRPELVVDRRVPDRLISLPVTGPVTGPLVEPLTRPVTRPVTRPLTDTDPSSVRRAAGDTVFARIIRACDTVALAAGVMLGLWLVALLPTIAVGVVLLAQLFATSRYRWQFSPALLDELPQTVTVLGGITLCTSSVLLLVQSADAARGALYAGGIIALTSFVGRTTGYALVRGLRCRGVALTNAVVVGSGAAGERLALGLEGNSRYGARFLGFVADGAADSAGTHPVLGSVDEIATIVRRHKIGAVLFAVDTESSETVLRGVRALSRARCEVFVVPRLLGLREVTSRHDAVDGVPLVRLRRAAFRERSWALKRVLDVAAAVFGLVVTAPVLAMIALAVRIELGRGVIFKQQRIGLDGKPFVLYKFRSLFPVAGEGDQRWNIEGDPRLGRVGNFIRSTGLDELPQLVNVLKGDMSLVGPRPERPFFVDKFNETVPGYRDRERVPAGVTGYAAVHGLRGDTSIEDRALLDNLYADSWSLWLDVKIIMRTLNELRSR